MPTQATDCRNAQCSPMDPARASTMRNLDSRAITEGDITGFGFEFKPNSSRATVRGVGSYSFFMRPRGSPGRVAQVSNLLYHRFAIGSATFVQAGECISRSCRLEALRYSRLGNLRYFLKRTLRK